MAVKQNFRTAFNGFNRDDVVHYIEYLNNQHNAELAQLNSDMEQLRTQLEQMQAQSAEEDSCEEMLSQANEAYEKLNQHASQQADRIAQLEQELKAAKADVAKLNSYMSAADAENGQLRSALKQAQNTAAEAAARREQARTEDELKAYRRAERTERQARERAQQICNQANGVLADATVQVDKAAEDLGAVAEHVRAQIQQLQDAVSGSTQALQQAAATLRTITAEPEE